MPLPRAGRAFSRDGLGMRDYLGSPHLAFRLPHWHWLGRVSRRPAGGTTIRAKGSQRSFVQRGCPAHLGLSAQDRGWAGAFLQSSLSLPGHWALRLQ